MELSFDPDLVPNQIYEAQKELSILKAELDKITIGATGIAQARQRKVKTGKEKALQHYIQEKDGYIAREQIAVDNLNRDIINYEAKKEADKNAYIYKIDREIQAYRQKKEDEIREVKSIHKIRIETFYEPRIGSQYEEDNTVDPAFKESYYAKKAIVDQKERELRGLINIRDILQVSTCQGPVVVKDNPEWIERNRELARRREEHLKFLDARNEENERMRQVELKKLIAKEKASG